MANFYIPLVGTPQIGDSGGGGGSGLPSVTADDNGDVLTVVNGQWDKAAPGGGGGGVMVVNLTWGDEYCEADKTKAEISDALDAGTPVFALVDGEEWFQIQKIGSSLRGISMVKSGNNISVGFWSVNALGQWSEELRTITTS